MTRKSRFGRSFSKKYNNNKKSEDFKFVINEEAQKILDLIGTPKKTPFTPDPFQREAINLIEQFDVLVTAPTGAGKTYIAVEAIRKIFDKGGRAWYASPLKALSNSKYNEFGDIFGSAHVGILTGDRKENSEAPIIVGTTEILRNQLYDAMHQGIDLNIELIVMDEAHYLGDEDRGVVWEEVLIYLPPRIRLLLLSATIQNAKEICNWLSWLRHRSCRWVCAYDRPVPLYPLFLFPSGELAPLGTKKGFFSRIDEVKSKSFDRNYFPDIPNIMMSLRKANLLPAIFFMKSRSDCEKAINLCKPVYETTLAKSREEFERRLRDLLEEYPFIKDHKHMEIIRKCRVGAHHGGQLPQWKALLEKLMQEGYLEAIFSTSTVAAGVNFPARTVVITQSDRFNGHEFVPLTSTELHQMTGRAGRRGMDEAGFVLVIPGPYQNPRYLYNLLKSPPDPITSRVKVNFSMVLNLLLSHKSEDIKELFSLSLATYQSLAEQNLKAKKHWERICRELNQWEEMMACGKGINFLDVRRQYKSVSSQISQFKRIHSRNIIPEVFQHLMVRGRVITTRQKVPYIILEKPKRDDTTVKALRLKIPLKTRRNLIKISSVKLSNIAHLHQHINKMPDLADKEGWEDFIEKLNDGHGNQKVSLNLFKSSNEELNFLIAMHSQMPCNKCELFGPCIKETNHPFTKAAYKYESLSSKISTIQEQLWRSFQYHYHFLWQEGYINSKGKLTEDGLWASKLRLDQPLLISECIRKNIFPADDPSLLAALVAPFVMDRDRSQDIEVTALAYLYPELYEQYFLMIQGIHGLKSRLQSWGFFVPPLPFWAAVSLNLWANREPWEKIIELFKVDEGDLVMLIIRTADHLNQMESLYETHPNLSESARKAREIIMREPVIAV